MTEQLHQRLADLAGDVASPGPADPAVLWRAGKRRQRRRTAAAGLAACAVLAGIGATGLALPGTGLVTTPVPAVQGDTLRVPDRLHVPSAWLPTTAEEGPIGPLALVITGGVERDLVGGETAYVGVSAVTGQYRFLSLPGLSTTGGAWGDTIALSADGRKLAYWYGGGGHSADEFAIEADGIAVYDTVTGDVVRRAIDSPHGIGGERPAWVGDKVWVSWFERVEGDPSSGVNGRTMSWDPETDRMERLPGGVVLPGEMATTTGSRAVLSGRSGVTILDARGRTERTVKVARGWEGELLLSPGGTMLAGRHDPDGDPSSYSNEPAPVLVGPASEAEAARLQSGAVCKVCPAVRLDQVPRSTGLTPVAWRDEEHLVVTRVADRNTDHERWEYVVLDVETGAVDEFIEPARATGSGNHLFAADAWTWPTWDAPAPDAPLNPRVVLGVGLVIVLASGLGSLLLWRRSRVVR
ncbi:hypothetical protein [Nocardioides sp.]|uniref:hypothetical protein n=1 Tax=Nocardioides sp. TaxID=35761 RepID=UPI002BA21EFF|nr:hypothetical protein [Nocardioides sp.]HSX69152.1 hypothetical protein [Nocardioides sp.]